MTQGFDEWVIDNLNPTYPSARQAYKAGAASRQAEIDSLRIELDGANERAAMTLNHKNKMVDKMQADIHELQKRINLALSAVWNDELSHIVIDILRGESDE